MKSSEVRAKFIQFFENKGHKFVPASPIVPQADPSLLFVNAGMNQFKDIFLGEKAPLTKRAVNSQPCVRVSGKHNDLEEVGADTTHLTLFEMLGNWSFGDYYKAEAISWAWELLTQVFKLPEDKLYATVFRTDDESFNLWPKLTTISPDRVLRFDEKDNFWEMAQTGPCGPCSEIHLDRGPEACDQPNLDHRCEVNGVCNRYIELWNLVFIQYDKDQEGRLTDLPAKHVDTGAGLERLVAVLQGKTSTYDTDLLKPIVDHLSELTGVDYATSSGMAHRVVSDHIRTLSFGIADHILPSNEGRGYVLRRLLRRAMRYARTLGVNEPILYKLVPHVVTSLGAHFTELKAQEAFIQKVVKAEETQFLKTLDAGLNHFQAIAKTVQSEGKTTIDGAAAFKLYDTYGFPIDLTEVLAKENQLGLDREGFEQLLAKQREQSRQAAKLNQGEAKEIPMGGEARIVDNDEDRLRMARHHTSTHLLQAALRSVLGDHVHQAGSLVDIDRLRFDFSHFGKVTPQELTKIEQLINAKVQENIPVTVDHKPIDQAKAEGALAFFGEKYGDIVRVIQIGAFSTELCGGTHVSQTEDIEEVKIVSESAVAAGTRRIEAVAGREMVLAYQMQQKESQQKQLQQKQDKLAALNQKLKALGGEAVDLPAGFEGHSPDANHVLSELIKAADKAVSIQQNKRAGENVGELLDQVQHSNQLNVDMLGLVLSGYDAGSLRNLSDNLIQANPNLLAILGAATDKGGVFLVRLGQNVDSSVINAKSVVQKLTAVAGGGGGGRPDMAQAGGADAQKLETAIQHVVGDLS